MALPEKNEEYATKEYWNSRYASEPNDSTFDWFKSYSQISELIEEYIPDKNSKILIVGCGNSTLSEEMWDNGYQNIVNIDYSNVLIEKMKAKHQTSRPGMLWIEMDVRNLTFDSGSFDVAIDKGTMDALMAGIKDVWNPPPEVVNDCTREVSEVLRVLRPRGIFLYLTFGQPHFRRQFLQQPETGLQIRQLGDSFHYYLYILTRQGGS